MDYTKIYRADVATLLGPADQVLVIVPYQLAEGAERIEGPPEELESRLNPLARRLHRRAREPRTGGRSPLDRILDVDWPWNRVDTDEMLAGVAVSGSTGSHAVRIADATRRAVGLFAVVTGQRFVIVRRTGTDKFELVAEVPRAEVVFARRQGRLFQRGRVVVGFADGSRLAVHTGVVTAGQAKRLVRILEV
jgi:hypothetical protein